MSKDDEAWGFIRRTRHVAGGKKKKLDLSKLRFTEIFLRPASSSIMPDFAPHQNMFSSFQLANQHSQHHITRTTTTGARFRTLFRRRRVQVCSGSTTRQRRPRRDGIHISAAAGERGTAGDSHKGGRCFRGACGPLLRASRLAAMLLPCGKVSHRFSPEHQTKHTESFCCDSSPALDESILCS